jgi:hypothetical protein
MKTSLIICVCLIWGSVSEDMARVKVPLWGQPDKKYCVPTCIKMILEFLRDNCGNVVPSVSIPNIAKVVRTQWDGTPPGNVELMNEYLKAKLSVKFKATYGQRFQDIVVETNEKETPVIAWLNEAKGPVNHSKILTDTSQLEDKLWHAVVVTYYDSNAQNFIYNDPWNAKEKSEEAGKFLRKWGVEGMMVKLLISRNEQAYLGTWLKENPLKGGAINE